MGCRRCFGLDRIRLGICALIGWALLGASGWAAGAADTPFAQAISTKHPLPPGLKGRKLCIDRDGIICILTSGGVARLIAGQIVLDQSYRPLAGKIPQDITLAGGELYYLFPNELLSNRRAGKFLHKVPDGFDRVGVSENGEALLTGAKGWGWLRGGKWTDGKGAPPVRVERIKVVGEAFFAIGEGRIFMVGEEFKEIGAAPGVTDAIAHPTGMAVGTTNGYFLRTGTSTEAGRLMNERRMPVAEINSLAWSGEYLWAGTARGVWRQAADGSFRYFASKRWLDQDRVIDLQLDAAGDAYALTETGLNIIEFRRMTLAEKARWYDRKIRQRHIRYGFCAELRLKTPGDITTAEMIDTDNDGTWSNYYMASQAFRYGATGEEEARRNAWETFEALERLEEINPLHGFPSRTFERVGFKVSDIDRWHAVGDGFWDWKAHTSSDEIAAHMFGSSVLYETTAKTDAERTRIVVFVGKIADHIIENNWYLIDMDGKPTLWGRWNPEYLNAIPKSMFDRRLNSAEVIAMLQFAHKITGRERYKEKAFELITRHGYLENILLPMSGIAETKGFTHLGITMGDEWNHSDDLLAFITYWVLHRYAFDEELRGKYAAAIREHWEIEKVEKCPLWNFVLASTGTAEFGLESALWTLRGFPLDLIDWTVQNRHRGDLTMLPPNFRSQESAELLPPGERRMTRWNGQPFVLDGGSGGTIEFGGDEFLLPYWMGRYLKVIGSE